LAYCFGSIVISIRLIGNLKKNPPAKAGGFWSFNGGWDAI
jgi:hypothetical protein